MVDFQLQIDSVTGSVLQIFGSESVLSILHVETRKTLKQITF